MGIAVLPPSLQTPNVVHLLWNAVITGVNTAELQLGENLKVDFILNRQINEQNDITYLVRDVLHFSLWGFVFLPTVCVVYALMLIVLKY